LAEFAGALEASALARWINETGFVYPLANTAHVIGAIMLVGVIGLLDLRILGYARGLSADALSRAATPIAVAALVIMVASGVVMFLADARALVRSPIFLTKLVLIVLAGVNALAFRWRWRVLSDEPALAARVFAGASLVLWLGVVVLGRLIAYF
jgi:hypothetical protein